MSARLCREATRSLVNGAEDEHSGSTPRSRSRLSQHHYDDVDASRLGRRRRQSSPSLVVSSMRDHLKRYRGAEGVEERTPKAREQRRRCGGHVCLSLCVCLFIGFLKNMRADFRETFHGL